MQTTYFPTALKQLPSRARTMYLPVSVWIKRHPLAAGAAAIVVLPLGLLGALALGTFLLTLPIAYFMELL